MTEPVGLRERKRRQVRAAIAAAAWRLFVERGFDAVTVAEIADAADVAKVTLFKYFPTKESLVLDVVADDEPARVVTDRRPGESPLAALRRHYAAFAADPGVEAPEALVASLRVIVDSPTLLAGMRAVFDRQREALAEALSAAIAANAQPAPGDRPASGAEPASDARPASGARPGSGDGGAAESGLLAALMAAQINGVLVTLKTEFFRRLVDSGDLRAALERLPADVDLAFDLLDHGLADLSDHGRAGQTDLSDHGRAGRAGAFDHGAAGPSRR